MTQAIIEQGIGFLAVICFIISFQLKSNRALFLCQMAGCALFCVQYFLLGAITGLLNNSVAIVRNTLLCKIDDWKWVAWKGWVPVFITICLVNMILTWQGPISLLPTIAVVAGTIGYWTNNAQKIRLCNMIAVSPAWLVYSVLIGTIGGILNEIIVMSSVVVSIYRYGWKNLGNSDFGKKKGD